jgi:hypothetical protein
VFRCNRPEAGYATLTAVVLCAAVSILCAGALSLADSRKRVEAGRLERLQRDEAINSAVMQFAADIIRGDDPFEAHAQKDIAVGGQRFAVSLSGQAEYAKWPLDKAGEVSEKRLAASIRQSRQDILARITSGKRDDCVASLFSNIGQIDPGRDRPTKAGIVYNSGSKDGQVWRIRAVTGARVEERRVRFLGDPDHLFALVSVHRTSLGDMPECADLIKKS